MNAPFRKNPGIPSFDLLKTDSSQPFNQSRYQSKHKTISILFQARNAPLQPDRRTAGSPAIRLKDIQIACLPQPVEEMVAFTRNMILKNTAILNWAAILIFFPSIFRMKTCRILHCTTPCDYLPVLKATYKISTLRLGTFE